ncbi:MAG: 3'-5' exonuclease, partial [Phenylobacterium sp.]|nr:3'-5' exonuclease [Phenylobacterium sp.]
MSEAAPAIDANTAASARTTLGVPAATPGKPHLMVDLETFGTSAGCAIASIGAVVFDPVQGALRETFYAVIDLGSCQEAGLTFEAGTVHWWLRQGDAARRALTDAKTVTLSMALGQFRMFFLAHARRAPIWSHGANFDEPILQAAFRAAHLPPPWDYWDARCTRTLFALAGVRPDRAVGVHHNALDDAVNQAEAVIEAYRILGLGRRPI